MSNTMVKILQQKLRWILSIIFNFSSIKQYEVNHKYFLNRKNNVLISNYYINQVSINIEATKLTLPQFSSVQENRFSLTLGNKKITKTLRISEVIFYLEIY